MSDLNAMRCSACSAPAKYEVNESYACGKHLATICNMHGKLGGSVDMHVKLIKRDE